MLASGDNVVAVWCQHDDSIYRIYSNYGEFVAESGINEFPVAQIESAIESANIKYGIKKYY